MEERRVAYRVLAMKPEGKTDGRIILRWIFGKAGCGGMDLIDLAQNRDRWRAFVKAGMNFGVP